MKETAVRQKVPFIYRALGRRFLSRGCIDADALVLRQNDARHAVARIVPLSPERNSTSETSKKCKKNTEFDKMKESLDFFSSKFEYHLILTNCNVERK